MKRSLAIAVACTCAFAASSALAQPTLGRLFFTHEERVRLAHARAGSPAGEAAPVDAQPAAMFVSGVVRNSRGGLVAWIDGRAVADGGIHAGFTVHVAGGGVTLRRAGQPAVWLPVGRPLTPSRAGTGAAADLQRGRP